VSLVVKFESNQDYQTEAIESVVDLFTGLERHEGVGVPSFNLTSDGELFQESVFGNAFSVTTEEVREVIASNLVAIQGRSRQTPDGETVPIIAPEARSQVADDDPLRDFSIEMETGTGKTYVYLRTAVELYLKYGLSKFVIVVPSVAIREGVMSTLRMTKEHFKEIYAGIQMDYYAYDSKSLNRLRQFATCKHLQILVMNIASFHKDENIINREADLLNGRAPIEFIQAVNPVVIMDEPQKLGSELQEAAIENLKPLLRLRYSATHRDHHHRLYRLSPIDAYNMRLVKRIDVLAVERPDNENTAFVEIKKVTPSKTGVTATALVNKAAGPKQVTLKRNDDLREVTGLEIYDGWIVEDIVAPTPDVQGHVEFQNGRLLRQGTDTGVDSDLWHRTLVKLAIQDHFETELKLAQRAAVGQIQPTKPLTLFFIDRVANYVGEEAKFRQWFEVEYETVSRDRRFRLLSMPTAKEVHKGYFASSGGKAKDSKDGKSTKDDDEAYDLIMRDKERLLSLDEPVRFIFSHSALAEGWDNPNVFTICNLQQVQSEVKRRQQIGRGLRLPVMANGERCRVEEVNHLTIVANESFEKYAKGLQKDIESETGETFNVPIRDKRTRVTVEPKKGFEKLEGFRELWSQIAPRTTYRLAFSTETLVKEAIKRLASAPPIEAPKVKVSKGSVEIGKDSGVAVAGGASRDYSVALDFSFTDLLGEVTADVPVSRSTVARIVNESGLLPTARLNPAQFRKQIIEATRHALAATLKDHSGIQYTPREGTHSKWDMEFFATHHAEAYEDTLVEVRKSIYDKVPVDSEVERRFALDLDAREDVVLFVKLPGWYKVDTPVGGYNPDWAIVRKDGEGMSLYLVRETKGSSNLDKLFREHEVWKVTFGRKHFDAINVDYRVVSKADELDNDSGEVLVD
jgi:type III restriction enzyme